MISELYDRPGAWLVDHPNSGKAVKRIVAAMTMTAALAIPAAASGSPGKVTNPGGVGQYGLVKPDRVRPNPGGVGQYRPRFN